MKLTFRTVAIATATAAVAALFSPGWSKQDGVSLSIGKAEALTRVYVRGYPYRGGYSRNDGVPWYAVRAYYWGGPWSGAGYYYAGWSDYATKNGIGCEPGTIVKGGDGINYLCQ
jgi:hypothetical protein